MNISVIGLGSMGKRRIKLIHDNYPEINLCGIDTNENRRMEIIREYNIHCYSSLFDCLQEQLLDSVFVCTSPKSHKDIIIDAINNDLNVFTEINLDNSYYQQVISMAKEKKVKLFLSSTLLYRREIQNIINIVHKYGLPVNYTYHVGQFLLDWHPWETDNTYFVFNKATNGCKEILTIQLPWITECFGEVSDMQCIKCKQSDLDIDFSDTYAIIMKHSNGSIGTLMIDVTSRPSICSLQIASKSCALRWTGTPESLQEYDGTQWRGIKSYNMYNHDEHYSNNILEDAYLEEIDDFFRYLRKDILPKYSFQKDQKIIDIVNRIEGD